MPEEPKSTLSLFQKVKSKKSNCIERVKVVSPNLKPGNQFWLEISNQTGVLSSGSQL